MWGARESSAAFSTGLLSLRNSPSSLGASTHSSALRLENKIRAVSLFDIVSLLQTKKEISPKILQSSYLHPGS